MSEPADPTTPRVDTSHGVGGARFSPRETPKTPQAGVLNIRRDVGDARRAYGPTPPALTAAATRARQAQIADRVEELDGRIIDLIVAAQALLLERGFETAMLIWASVDALRDRLPLDEPKLGIELPRLAGPNGDTAENLLRVIASAERCAEQLRTSFPKLTMRHS
jgi:hypothetical protein